MCVCFPPLHTPKKGERTLIEKGADIDVSWDRNWSLILRQKMKVLKEEAGIYAVNSVTIDYCLPTLDGTWGMYILVYFKKRKDNYTFESSEAKQKDSRFLLIWSLWLTLPFVWGLKNRGFQLHNRRYRLWLQRVLNEHLVTRSRFLCTNFIENYVKISFFTHTEEQRSASFASFSLGPSALQCAYEVCKCSFTPNKTCKVNKEIDFLDVCLSSWSNSFVRIVNC